MNNFKFVRRATERDLEVRKSRIDKSKNKATLDQLQKMMNIMRFKITNLLIKSLYNTRRKSLIMKLIPTSLIELFKA